MSGGLDPRTVRHYHLLTLAAPVAFLVMVVLVALGIGRLIDPLLLGGVLGLGYIAVAVLGWWEPRETDSEAVGERTPDEGAPARERREGHRHED